MLFEAVVGQLSVELRFEARIRLEGGVLLGQSHDDLVTGLAVFKQNVPIVMVLFHFVLLGGYAELFGLALLRFEPNVGGAAFFAELLEVIQRFVEGARVGGLIAHI